MAHVKDNGNQEEILDKLHGLPLKGFEEIDETPTSGTASLPTPDAGHAVISIAHPEASSYKIDDDWYDKCEDDEYMAYLNAPLMKDMDSFTEGTGHGSFDCLPSAYNDEHEQLFPPIDSLSLSLLPPVEALSTSIVTWRDNIMDTQTSSDPVDIPRPKRQRSASPVYVRNTRARAQSLSSVINWPPSIECPFSRADVERRSRSEAPD